MWAKSIFPIAFPHFMSVSHFGNSPSISNLLIIMFLSVICDL